MDNIDLQALAKSTPTELCRRAKGRETFRWSGPAGERFVVKRFTSSWSSSLLLTRPARVEHENLSRLAEAGLRVPRPVALYESSPISLVVMEEIDHESDLRRRLGARPSEAARWMPEVLALTLGLHTRGWYHRDLYLDHFVLERKGEGSEEFVALLDLGRARKRERPRRRWFVKDLAALLHSTPAGVSTHTQLRFLCRYLDARGIQGRAARRWWCAAVQRKARKMAAHTPRGGTSFHSGVEVVS